MEGWPHTTDPDPEDGRVVRGLATYEPEKDIYRNNMVARDDVYTVQRTEIFQHIINTLASKDIGCCHRYKVGTRPKPSDWLLSADG